MERGTVEVTQGGRKVGELTGGDWLGEIALLTKTQRTATARATTPVRLLVITDRAFKRLVKEMPSIAIKVLTSVADRLARDTSAASVLRGYASAASPRSARASAKKSASGFTR